MAGKGNGGSLRSQRSGSDEKLWLNFNFGKEEKEQLTEESYSETEVVAHLGKPLWLEREMVAHQGAKRRNRDEDIRWYNCGKVRGSRKWD
jgi:hypothetical protein